MKYKPQIVVDCEVYPIQVGVFTTQDRAVKWASERGLEWEFENHLGWAKYITSPQGDAYFLLYLPEDSTSFTVSHEALHMAVFILDFVGVKYDADNHEALAYFHEYLFRRVSEEMGRKKKK